MDRVDLLNHLRVVRDYCHSIDVDVVSSSPAKVACKGCVIEDICKNNFKIISGVPVSWELEDE